MARVFLCGYSPDLDICHEVLPLMFDKKLDIGNSLVLIVPTLVSDMVDQVHSSVSRAPTHC